MEVWNGRNIVSTAVDSSEKCTLIQIFKMWKICMLKTTNPVEKNYICLSGEEYCVDGLKDSA